MCMIQNLFFTFRVKVYTYFNLLKLQRLNNYSEHLQYQKCPKSVLLDQTPKRNTAFAG